MFSWHSGGMSPALALLFVFLFAVFLTLGFQIFGLGFFKFVLLFSCILSILLGILGAEMEFDINLSFDDQGFTNRKILEIKINRLIFFLAGISFLLLYRATA